MSTVKPQLDKLERSIVHNLVQFIRKNCNTTISYPEWGALMGKCDTTMKRRCKKLADERDFFIIRDNARAKAKTFDIDFAKLDRYIRNNYGKDSDFWES